jgi:hypothetical protein
VPMRETDLFSLLTKPHELQCGCSNIQNDYIDTNKAFFPSSLPRCVVFLCPMSTGRFKRIVRVCTCVFMVSETGVEASISFPAASISHSAVSNSDLLSAIYIGAPGTIGSLDHSIAWVLHCCGISLIYDFVGFANGFHGPWISVEYRCDDPESVSKLVSAWRNSSKMPLVLCAYWLFRWPGSMLNHRLWRRGVERHDRQLEYRTSKMFVLEVRQILRRCGGSGC